MSDTLTFSSAAVPSESELPQGASLPADESPHDGPHCIVCGTPLEYSGRGRKPKYCDEHKKSGTRTGVKSSTPRNDKLAAQATDALMQINGLGALVCMLAGMPMTAAAINNAEEGLREQVKAALITDPDLASKILSAGTHSAKISLVIAYGMFAAAVAPVGVMEFKANKARRELENGAAEDEGTDNGGNSSRA